MSRVSLGYPGEIRPVRLISDSCRFKISQFHNLESGWKLKLRMSQKSRGMLSVVCKVDLWYAAAAARSFSYFGTSTKTQLGDGREEMDLSDASSFDMSVI